MIVVDASVWVSSALPYDEFHTTSRGWLDGRMVIGEPLGGPTILLAEVSGAVSRRSGNAAEAHAAVRRIEATPRLVLRPMDDDLVRVAASLAGDHSLRGADAVYVATAVHFGCPLITWDDEMIRKARDVVDTRQPSA